MTMTTHQAAHVAVLEAFPRLPKPKYLAKLSRDGEWAELCPADDWTAEMWAHGTESVYTAEQMHAYALAAIELMKQAAGWQPIETAPKDGRVILFCDHRGNRWTQTAGCRLPMCGYLPAHWMSLPAAPTEASR